MKILIFLICGALFNTVGYAFKKTSLIRPVISASKSSKKEPSQPKRPTISPKQPLPPLKPVYQLPSDIQSVKDNLEHRLDDTITPLPIDLSMRQINPNLGFSSQEMYDLRLINENGIGIAQIVENCRNALFLCLNQTEIDNAKAKNMIIPEPEYPTLQNIFQSILSSEKIPGTEIPLLPVTKYFFYKFFCEENPFFTIDQISKTSQTLFILSFLKLADTPIFRDLLFNILRMRKTIQKRQVPSKDLEKYSSFLNYKCPNRTQDVQNNWLNTKKLKIICGDGFAFDPTVYSSENTAFMKVPTVQDFDANTINLFEALELPNVIAIEPEYVFIGHPLRIIPYELAVAHEIIHMFNFMRAPFRFQAELNSNLKGFFNINGQFITEDSSGPSSSSCELQSLVNDWLELAQCNPRFTSMCERIWAGSNNKVNFNDFKVIMGEFFKDGEGPIHSISENVLRLLWGEPLRIGCDFYGFFERKAVYEKILENAKRVFQHYGLQENILQASVQKMEKEKDLLFNAFMT